jgi:hypothetical protein
MELNVAFVAFHMKRCSDAIIWNVNFDPGAQVFWTLSRKIRSITTLGVAFLKIFDCVRLQITRYEYSEQFSQ